MREVKGKGGRLPVWQQVAPLAELGDVEADAAERHERHLRSRRDHAGDHGEVTRGFTRGGHTREVARSVAASRRHERSPPTRR